MQNSPSQMFLRSLNMPQILTMPGIWMYWGSEHACSCEYVRVLNVLAYWINQGFKYTRFLKISLVLKMLWFWIDQGFEYVWVTQGSEYVWICLNDSLICLDMPNMPGYERICLNPPDWLLFYIIPLQSLV